MKKIVLYAAVGVVAMIFVAAVAVGAAYLVLNKMPATAKVEEKSPEVEVSASNVFPLKPFVTNLADQSPPRYVNVTLELVLRSEKEMEKLKEILPLIRDTIISTLNAKKAADVVGESGSSSLKTDIRDKLNALLGKPLIDKVLITDFAVQ